MKVRRRVLDSAKGKRLDRTVRSSHHSVNHLRLIVVFSLQVVHQIVGVKQHSRRQTEDERLPTSAPADKSETMQPGRPNH